MNAIMNRGFVHPYIVFQFDAGTLDANTIDTEPPRYFVSFTQNRTTDEACTFTLTLMYAPQASESEDTNRIHGLLLSSVNKPVFYQYGYVTPGGGIVTQNQVYTGLFTNYNEQLEGGYLTYTISGVSRSYQVANEQVNVTQFLNNLKSKGGTIQPSVVARQLVEEDDTTGIKELFQNFEIRIDHCDEPVDVDEINFYGNTLHDVFFGTVMDTYVQPGGLVSLSRMPLSAENGIFSDREMSLYNTYRIKVANGISSEITADEQAAYDAVKMLSVCPFVCYYDNVVSVFGDSLKGTFHYVPKYTRQVTSIFEYHYGNSFIDSDVLSFDAKIDGAKAMGTVTSLDRIDSSIDANGNLQGSNLNAVGNLEAYKPNTYSTVSGFNDAAMVSSTVLAEALNFPFEAEMTIIGQTECNKLLDKIHVDVYVNGVKNTILTGDYIIKGITDNLSQDGFTTTFTLFKSVDGIYDSSDVPSYIASANDWSGRAFTDQRFTRDDYGK